MAALWCYRALFHRLSAKSLFQKSRVNPFAALWTASPITSKLLESSCKGGLVVATNVSSSSAVTIWKVTSLCTWLSAQPAVELSAVPGLISFCSGPLTVSQPCFSFCCLQNMACEGHRHHRSQTRTEREVCITGYSRRGCFQSVVECVLSWYI